MAGGKLQLTWQVLRGDTNAVVANLVVPYSAGQNGPSIDHQSGDLYTVKSFIVRCTATLTLGNQVGEIWTDQQILTIEDNLDRSHSFVEWGPRWVYFQAPNSTPQAPVWWGHDRRSRIHRTAVAARCKMLQRKAIINEHAAGVRGQLKAPFVYRDSLPFPWEEVAQHRKVLCEYCFFGGPDKFVPLPREDWFETLPDFLIGRMKA